MKPEFELKLQSYLDGELAESEAREIEALLASDAEAQMLSRELKTTTTLLRENEPQLAVPESREFYWSKIERAIECAEPEPANALFAAWVALRRILVPVAGVALVLFLGIASFKVNTTTPESASYLTEVESLSEHVSSFSFRSQSENMFVVWLHENTGEQSTPEADDGFDDAILQ